MICPITRMVKKLHLGRFLPGERKPRIEPMSELEKRVQAELHRRRDEIQRRKRDSRS